MAESRDVTEPKHDEVRMQLDVKIPLRDGVCLNATLYLPARQIAPAPVIFTQTPYIGQNYYRRGLYCAARGFPFLSVDVRGRGNSEGRFKPFANEGRDGHDVVEWLARQPYCNGQVAMWGGSYEGYCQWAAAMEFPPHLAAIIPTSAPYFGVDLPGRGHLPVPYMMQWLTLVSGRALQDRFCSDQSHWSRQFQRWFESGAPFKELDSLIGNRSEVWQEWLDHPQQDAYWDAHNPTARQYARLCIPILTITGSYDGDQPGALMHYRQLLENASNARQHYLVIGPWDHSGSAFPKTEFCGIKVGPQSVIDIPKLHLEWYAWVMQGGPKPAFLQDNVAYYVIGAEQWRYSSSLDQVTSHHVRSYLHSRGNPTDVFHSGQLAAEPSVGVHEPDYYVDDPRDVSHATVEATVSPESLVDQRMLHVLVGKQLVYHTTPFERDTEISGFFKLSLWLSIDQPDADFGVSIYEVGLDGGSVLLTSDSLRARYRESLREAKLIRTTEPLRYDFVNFMFVSRQIKQGNRLRLVIGPVSSIYRQRNYNGGGDVASESVRDARTVTVRLYHDRAHPSVLEVPHGRPQG